MNVTRKTLYGFYTYYTAGDTNTCRDNGNGRNGSCSIKDGGSYDLLGSFFLYGQDTNIWKMFFLLFTLFWILIKTATSRRKRALQHVALRIQYTIQYLIRKIIKSKQFNEEQNHDVSSVNEKRTICTKNATSSTRTATMSSPTRYKTYSDSSSTTLSKSKKQTSCLSQDNQSKPLSPFEIDDSTKKHHIDRKSEAIASLPYNHSYSHPHQRIRPLHFHTSTHNSKSHSPYHHPDEDDDDNGEDDLEDDNDMDRFHKLYPRIQKSPYAKLCLPPTCQRIPLTRRTSFNKTSRGAKPEEIFYPLRFLLHVTQLEYWTKFWFLFLPSWGSIIWKMILGCIKGKKEDDDEDDDDTIDNVSVISQKSNATTATTGSNSGNKVQSSKTAIDISSKTSIVTASTIERVDSLSSFRSIQTDPDHEHEDIDENYPPKDTILSIPSSPHTKKEKDALKQYQKRSSNFKTFAISTNANTNANTSLHTNTNVNVSKQPQASNIRPFHTSSSMSSSHHPHILTIFPTTVSQPISIPSSSTSIGLPIDSTNNHSTTPIISNAIDIPSGNNKQLTTFHNHHHDPPMNFFDAEASSDAIDNLTRKLPVLPDKHGYILENTKKSSTPLLVFVNSRSGPQQGQVLLNQLKRLLNPIQIWDLAQDGNPEIILESFSSVFKNLRILVCGGDGTVSWILSSLEQLARKINLERWPPVAILPLGTGNDLARIHGWGGGYSNESLLGILRQVRDAYVSMLDRWDLSVRDKKGRVKVQKCFTNYLGVGVDAQVAFQMHTLRESKPKLFFSRAINKAWYGIFGAEDVFKATYAGLTDRITLIADGVEIPLPPDSQGIIFLNIDSYSGGVPLWSHGTKRRHSRRHSFDDHDSSNSGHGQFGEGYGLTFPSAGHKLKQNSISNPFYTDRVDSIDEADSDNHHFQYKSNNIMGDSEQKIRRVTACNLPSSCQDGLLDVVSVRSAFHLGQIRVGLSNAEMICQCHEAIIKTNKAVAVQVDGEPWKQNGPSTLKITRKKDPAIMLHRAADDGGGVETEMSKLLDWAEERRIIDRKVHATLMKEFSRRIESKRRQERVQSQDNLMLSLKRAISSTKF